MDGSFCPTFFDSGNIVSILGNIFLYPPQGHPILYKYVIDNNNEMGHHITNEPQGHLQCVI